MWLPPYFAAAAGIRRRTTMNECVLVVDDDREIVKAIGLLLEKEGYQVLNGRICPSSS